MWKVVIVLAALAAVVLGAFTARYINRNAVVHKIDEDVTLVTLDSIVIVVKAGTRPRVERLRKPPTQGQPLDIKPTAPLKWTLPYSCSDVHFYSSHFTRTQLEAMRKAAGMAPPTPNQRAQIQACLAGRLQ